MEHSRNFSNWPTKTRPSATKTRNSSKRQTLNNALSQKKPFGIRKKCRERTNMTDNKEPTWDLIPRNRVDNQQEWIQIPATQVEPLFWCKDGPEISRSSLNSTCGQNG
jgi:hypothetical protein